MVRGILLVFLNARVLPGTHSIRGAHIVQRHYS